MRRLLIFGLLVSIGLLVSGFGLSVVHGQGYGDALLGAMEKARRLKCQNNLKQIHAALERYRGSAGGWPSDLNALVQKKLIDVKLLKCPSAASPAGSIDFVFRKPASGNGEEIIVYDKATNHSGGCNVLQLDGTTQWLTTAQFKKRMGG